MKSWEWKKPINKLFNDSQIHNKIKPQKMKPPIKPKKKL